jgi:tyrosine-protein kinase Etk/Wzc
MAIETPNRHTMQGTAELSVKLDQVRLIDVLLVLAHRRWLVFFTTLACFLMGVLLACLLPVQYTATVTLLPPQQGSSIGSVLASELGGLGSMAGFAGGGFGLKNSNDMFVSMLKSAVVENAIIAQFDLRNEYHRRYLSETRLALEKRATIEGGLKDNLLHISVEDSSPQRALQMTNAYVDQLRNLSHHLALTEAEQRKDFYTQQFDQTETSLTKAEETLRAVEQKTGIIQPEGQTRALIETAATLRAQVTAKEVQIQGIRSYAAGENAQLTQATQELAGLRAMLTSIEGKNGADSKSLIGSSAQLTGASLEYAAALRDVKYYETELTLLGRQMTVAQLDEAKEGSFLQVIDPAILPDKRSSPKRTLIVLCATAVGLIFGILLALIAASFDRWLADPLSARKLALLRQRMILRREVTP